MAAESDQDLEKAFDDRFRELGYRPSLQVRAADAPRKGGWDSEAWERTAAGLRKRLGISEPA